MMLHVVTLAYTILEMFGLGVVFDDILSDWLTNVNGPYETKL